MLFVQLIAAVAVAGVVLGVAPVVFPRLLPQRRLWMIGGYVAGELISLIPVVAIPVVQWHTGQDVQAANTSVILALAFVIQAVVALVLLSRRIARHAPPGSS